MLQGELSKILAHGLKTLYPLKKIEIRRSEVLGVIADELPLPEPSALTEVPSAPDAVVPVADGGDATAA